MARFGEKEVFGSRVLVEAKSVWFGGSLWRQGCFLEIWVGGSEVTASSVLVARWGEEEAFGTCVLVEAKSPCSGGSLLREGGFREHEKAAACRSKQQQLQKRATKTLLLL